MFKNPKSALLLILALVAGAGFLAFQQPARLGLDLKGGTRLTLEATPSADVKQITPDVMDSLHAVIDRRVNGLGVGESIVQRSAEKRLIVEIPGIQDPEAAKRMLGRVGQLEFRQFVKSASGTTDTSENAQWKPTGVSGKDLSRANVGTGGNGSWQIDFELNADGTDKFGKLTTQLAQGQQPLGIFFDGKLVSAPRVNEPIVQGRGQITGTFTHDEAKDIVDLLNAGALPVNIQVIEESSVGPLLGMHFLQQSLFAGGIGLGLVALFMLVFYRSKGMVANVALVIYTLLTYAAFLLCGVTFTLAGIAGFILSIGMAVDANILIFERTREEQDAGRSLLRAVDSGFDRAFPSILDSNTTTIITCVLLWVLGTGAVKGFALTLAIGVGISMFSAIFVTRTLLQLLMTSGRPVKPALSASQPGQQSSQQPSQQGV
jgi:preprotein translocase subunit SecD